METRTLVKAGKPVYWNLDGAWQAGKLLTWGEQQYQITHLGLFKLRESDSTTLILVQHAQTGELEFVEWSKLHNYYGDKTPPEFEPEHASVSYKSDEELRAIGSEKREEKELSLGDGY